MSVTLLVANITAHAVQTTIIIGSALVMLSLVRITAPGVRYVLLRGLLALCLLLPLIVPRVALLTVDEVPAARLEGSRPGFSLPWQDRGTNGSERRHAGAAVAGVQAIDAWAGWILWALVAGTGIRLTSIAAGLVRLRRLRSAGESAPPSPEYDELQQRIGTRAETQIRFVPQLGQPATFGVRRPVVLLPEALRPLPMGIQRAVLAHELWHVKRYDWSWVLFEELVRAALWFQPAIWVLISRIQSAREETVDELAILATGSRRSYLDALVTFADRPSVFAAAAFARRRHLVHRMLMISKEHVMSSTRVVACSAALLAVVAGASWYSVEAFPLTAHAQAPRDRVPPPPPPPAPVPDFPQQEAALRKKVQEQPNAVNYHALATLYFEKARTTADMTAEDKSKVVADGLSAADAALSYDPDYVEALIYKNLLLRVQAQLETNPDDRVRIVAEADRLRSRAMALRKQQPAQPQQPGTMPPPPPPPPPPDEASTSSAMVDGEFPIRVGGNIAPPTKIRDVRPVYPPEALANKVAGVVIVQATIDREGKVRDARVLKSIPLLDAAAVEAVRQWEFTPTLLNGVPKPVIMVLTINFTLE
jgi:TonB family protein